MARIVSITPVALERDSRTLKMACSFARAGHESIVVEGVASVQRPDISDVQVLTLASTAAMPGADEPGEPGEPVGPEAAHAEHAPLPAWRRLARPLTSRLRRSSWAGVMDAWTLLLHLRALWQRTGPRVARSLPDADLYYVHAYDLAPAVLLRRVRAGRSTPLIYDAHDLYQELLLAGEPTRFVRRYVARIDRFLEARLCAASHAVVTTSAGMARTLAQRYRCRAEVVRNCHDRRLDRSDVAPLRASLALPVTARLGVVVGNRKPGHALHELLQAMQRCGPELHLAFVGDGYHDLAQEMGVPQLEHRLHASGRVAPGSIVPLIRDADFSVLPYVARSAAYEQFLPNGFFQAVAAGLPLLYPGSIAGVAELGASLQLGQRVDPASVDDMAAALRRMCSHDDWRRARRGNALRAAEELSWEHEEWTLMSIVSAVLEPAA